jgi:serine/threonine-protein kinase RsbW
VSRLELIINSDINDASLVAVAVNSVCAHLGLDPIRAGEVELCIAEAVTNAIKHAYHGTPGKRISVAITTSADRIHFLVTENGTSMQPEYIKRLVHGADAFEVSVNDLNLIPEGGRGLQIIHDLMDTVGYVSENDANYLHLTKRLPKEGRGE